MILQGTDSRRISDIYRKGIRLNSHRTRKVILQWVDLFQEFFGIAQTRPVEAIYLEKNSRRDRLSLPLQFNAFCFALRFHLEAQLAR